MANVKVGDRVSYHGRPARSGTPPTSSGGTMTDGPHVWFGFDDERGDLDPLAAIDQITRSVPADDLGRSLDYYHQFEFTVLELFEFRDTPCAQLQGPNLGIWIDRCRVSSIEPIDPS